jgi:hypothetical protein
MTDYFIVSLFSHVSMIQNLILPVVYTCQYVLDTSFSQLGKGKLLFVSIHWLIVKSYLYALSSLWNRDSHAQNKGVVIYIAKYVYGLM